MTAIFLVAPKDVQKSRAYEESLGLVGTQHPGADGG